MNGFSFQECFVLVHVSNSSGYTLESKTVYACELDAYRARLSLNQQKAKSKGEKFYTVMSLEDYINAVTSEALEEGLNTSLNRIS